MLILEERFVVVVVVVVVVDVRAPRQIPTMPISNLIISCASMTVLLITDFDMNCFVTIGWIPNCNASNVM